MTTTDDRLKAEYERLLSEWGLDSFTLPVDRDAFELTWNGGYWDAIAPGSTKEEAWEIVQSKGIRPGERIYEGAMEKLRNEIADDLCQSNAVLPCPVYMAAVPLGFVNGFARPVDGGVLVLLNYGLLHLLFQVAKIFIWSMDWIHIEIDGVDSSKSLSQNFSWETCDWTKERSIEAIAQVYIAYAQKGSATFAPRQDVVPVERVDWFGRIQAYAERFLALHEYAHVLLYHSGPHVTVETPYGSLRDILERSRQNEMDADILAASLLMGSCDMSLSLDDATYRVAGIALLFASNLFHDTIREGAPGMAAEAEPLVDHPTANERLLKIFDFLDRKYGRSVSQKGRVCIHWALEVLIPVFERAHSERGSFRYL